MANIFSDQIAITPRRECILYATSKFFFTGTFSRFSKSVCFALKLGFLIYIFTLEN